MSKKTGTSKKAVDIPEPDFSSDIDYWTALGQFIEAFTRAENQLFLYLIFAVKIDKKIGKAIFERYRCAELLATLSRVWDVESPEPEKRKELEEAIVQFKIIQNERNSIVHNISYVYDDRGRVRTNRLRARTDMRIDELPVSPQHLNNMAADLLRITDHFLSSWYHPSVPLATRKSHYKALAKPWQYKQRKSKS